ncbi:uncharacterized protein B4U80_00101 [Leptotrombidium deliense]|uniref:Spaetzle domain-containing protein n=1 Tax=Leptotrombidium deliense TaxID=299467 RepID=A0A443SIK5_9ACAR|nr:uncharacterized protein B4U80_00101 [Leptotrombidium deliense]
MSSLKEFDNKILCCFLILWCVAATANKTPPGYYAFEKAMKINGIPPRVRKPPYVPADIPCPGAVKSGFYYSPKDTLCGDLNRGFVPLNPMKQSVNGQPYPFEIIKNKTLYHLSQTLPFLKKDINNIPKVAKLASMRFPNNHHLQRRSPDVNKQSYFENVLNLTEARQKVCEHKDGVRDHKIVSIDVNCHKFCDLNCVLCQVMQAVSGGQMSNALNQAAQVLTAAHSAANTAQSLGSLASLFQQYSNNGNIGSQTGTTDNTHNNKSIISQILNFIASFNGNSQNANFNPLSAIIDYFSNGNSAVASSLLPARRKKPLELEDVVSESPVEQIPPTPCPSIEEYVAPVFARNYQGVWKYVVQIPHEGYFTQTVQKTTCVKGRCDFLDGVCHESPRWVSLLVAEIYYPNAHFPNVVASSSSLKPHIVDVKQHGNSLNHLNELPVSDELFEQFLNQYRHEEAIKEKSAHKPRTLVRRASKDEKDSRKNASEEEKCDGYDKLGCYVVRVYHDWFLVPGSCKCWKKSSQSGLETIKKIFIGK